MTETNPVISLAAHLGAQEQLLPSGSLAILFHAAASTLSDLQNPRDAAEARNFRIYRELHPKDGPHYTHATLSGGFKPPSFIHPFEEFYSLPGYLDAPALDAFFKITDEKAANLSHNQALAAREGHNFMAFTYMFFLLIHPFIDGNGRVARGLLDYYNTKLNLGFLPLWHEKSFKTSPDHKKAFDFFFREEAHLLPRAELQITDPYPISERLTPELERMSKELFRWITEEKQSGGLAKKGSRDHLSGLFRQGIKV